MRVLLTGAGGFLGGVIAARLAARRDVELIRAVRRDPPPGALALELADADAAAAALAGLRPDVVVHAAGRAVGGAAELEADNLRATVALARSLAAASPGAGLVLLGSASQYGDLGAGRPWRETDPCDPITAYGGVKQRAEDEAFRIARGAGVSVAALRLFNAVAASPAGDQVFPTFLRRAAQAVAAGPPPWRVAMGPLGGVRDFIAAEDVARAAEAVIDRGAWGEPINVASGVGRPVRALIEAVVACLPGPMHVDEAAGGGVVPWSVGDPARCEARLGWRPSADLSAVTAAAAAWIAAHARTHARSRA